MTVFKIFRIDAVNLKENNFVEAELLFVLIWKFLETNKFDTH